METLVRLYAAGLKNLTKAAKIVRPAWPRALGEAMKRVAAGEVQASNLQRLGIGRTEEPMEIDAYREHRMEPMPMEKDMHLLKTQYGKLQAKDDRLLERLTTQAQTTNRPTATGPPPKKKTDDGVCFGCGNIGHLKRHCPKKTKQPSIAAAATLGPQSHQ